MNKLFCLNLIHYSGTARTPYGGSIIPPVYYILLAENLSSLQVSKPNLLHYDSLLLLTYTFALVLGTNEAPILVLALCFCMHWSSSPDHLELTLQDNIDHVCLLILLIDCLVAQIVSLSEAVDQARELVAGPMLQERDLAKKVHLFRKRTLFYSLQTLFIIFTANHCEVALLKRHDCSSSRSVLDQGFLPEALATWETNHLCEPLSLLFQSLVM